MSSPLPVNAVAKYGACELRDGSLKSGGLVQVATGGGLKSEKTNCSVDESTTDEEAALEAPPEPKTFILRMAKRIPCLGILMAMCASFFLGSAGMLVKMTRSVHGIQVAVLR